MTDYKESEVAMEALKVLNETDGGSLDITELIRRLEERLNPSGEDQRILGSRSDTVFSQKVRNIVSHRTTPKNIIVMGYVTYDKSKRPGRLCITDEGRSYISSN